MTGGSSAGGAATSRDGADRGRRTAAGRSAGASARFPSGVDGVEGAGRVDADSIGAVVAAGGSGPRRNDAATIAAAAASPTHAAAGRHAIDRGRVALTLDVTRATNSGEA